MYPKEGRAMSHTAAFISAQYSRLSFTNSSGSTQFSCSSKRRRTSLCAHSRRRQPTSLLSDDDRAAAPKIQPPGTDSHRLHSSSQQAAEDGSQSMSSSSSNGISRPDTAEQSIAAPDQESSDSFSPVVRIPFGSKSISIPARWLLYAVPFMWGSFGPAVRLLFSQQPHQDPSVFNTERLLLSTIVYIPVFVAEINLFLNRNEPENKTQVGENRFAFFPAGIELGVYVFLANVAQVIGLQQTSASRAAFLVQLQTVIVPVLSGLFGIDKITPKTWLSSLVAIAGVALLSSDKGHGAVSSFTGDALEIVSALFFSTYIIRLGKYCNALPANPLVATKIAVQAILSIGWAVLANLGTIFHHVPTDVSETAEVLPWTLPTIGITIGVVAWTGLVSSAISGWAQTTGQRGVPASEAVIIFATQPLWASALATFILHESFGPKGLAGGALIVAATLLASVKGGNDDGKMKIKNAKQ